MKLYGTFLNFFGFLVAFSIVSLTLAGQIPTPSYELCILQKIDELRGCDVYFPDKKMSVPESSVQHMCSGIQKKLRCEFEVLLHSCGEKATRSIIKHQKIQIPPTLIRRYRECAEAKLYLLRGSSNIVSISVRNIVYMSILAVSLIFLNI